jgi:predicted  nucleic acid-binding Zn-ribbon protein
LQIYQLVAERKRLERGVREWRLRLQEAEGQLSKINRRIEELQQTTEAVKPTAIPKRAPLGTGGAMVIEY